MTQATSTMAPVNKNAILSIIIVSYLMIVLDISIIIAALPRLKQDLGFSDAGLSWVQNAYTLTFGGLLLSALAPDSVLISNAL